MKAPKTDAQRASEAAFSPMKIDLHERKESVARYEAIRESVRRFLESTTVNKGDIELYQR